MFFAFSLRLVVRYEHKSALPTSASPRELRPAVKVASSAECARATKLEILISAESPELAREAAKEACVLAPGSMYLGGVALVRLAQQFQEIARQMHSGENELSLRGGGGGGGSGSMDYRGTTQEADGGLLGKEFDAYNEILEAAVAAAEEEDWPEESGRRMACPLSREEVDRLERMRGIVQPSASRVVGRAVAHQALETAWERAAIVDAV